LRQRENVNNLHANTFRRSAAGAVLALSLSRLQVGGTRGRNRSTYLAPKAQQLDDVIAIRRKRTPGLNAHWQCRDQKADKRQEGVNNKEQAGVNDIQRDQAGRSRRLNQSDREIAQDSASEEE